MTQPCADPEARKGGGLPDVGAISAGTAIPAVLKKRAEFVAASRARRQAMPGFILQARRRGADEPVGAPVRIGFTCSKKVGNSVARNRAKRRLREIARKVLPGKGRPGWDYVLIGRSVETARRPFADLVSDLESALVRVHRNGTR